MRAIGTNKATSTHRRTLLGGTLAGVAVSALLGTGILALVSETIEIGGNQAESGDVTVPSPDHDLEVAVLPNGVGSCSDSGLVYETAGPIVGGVSRVHDLQNDVIGASATRHLCLRNAGHQSGRVIMSATVIAETELATCDADEAAVDTTCAAGDAGELERITLLGSGPQALGGDPGCSEPEAPAIPLSDLEEEGVTVETALEPGETCRLSFSTFITSGATALQKQRAQSDRITYSVNYTMVDAALP